jgi:hypothetical protein
MFGVIDLFLGFSLFAWIGFIILSIVLTALIDHDQWAGSSVLIVLTFGGLHFLYPTYSIWLYAINNPWPLVQSAAFYIFAGVVWSFVKWYFYLLNVRDKQREKKNPYFEIPTAGNSKVKLIGWLSFWPWSLVWTIINDPIRRLFNRLFLMLSSTYNSISNSMFKEYIAVKEKETAVKAAEEKVREEERAKRR